MRRPKTINIRQILMILTGSGLLAFTYYHINFQNHLAEGGFVGVALICKYLFNLPPGLMTILLDIPLMILAFFLKGRRFIGYMLLGSVSFSAMYEACERFSPLQLDLHHNLLLVAIISGLLTGIGAGLVLRGGGACGGDDILALCLTKWTGLKIGTVFIVLDAAVLLLSLLFLPLKETLFTVLAVLIGGKMITWVVGYQMKTKPAVSISYVVDMVDGKTTAKA
ncbi:YitT family protein [Paenibacillus pinistramenti]|uniref:YitT family protein n=1 Tax=Paenibacillus pinistramenti TaxID=1768003 RepID=UPI00110952E2|nr:YitT family protein [Paenibacillus pinistramenti]